VPFITGFQIYPWLERLLNVRRHPLVGYAIALALVALAILVRWWVEEAVGPRVPFITFYPAIVMAAVLGGLWPGVVATVLSTVAAWYLFIPPFHSLTFDQREIVQLLLFVFICSINVAVAAVLNALVERLVLQQRNIRLLLESAQNGVVLVDHEGNIKLVNAATERLFGYDRAELAGKNVEVLVPDNQSSAHGVLRLAYSKMPEARLMGVGRDLRGRRKDGSEIPVEIGLNPVGEAKEGSAVLATVVDISARKLKEEHQQLVIRELEHRTRNLFAVVQAIVRNTLKDAKTLTQGEYVLSGRLKALAQAYSLPADGAWEGASLNRILEQQILVHSKRIDVTGCDIDLSLRAAQQFALIIHELSTNALKYGALSVPGGRVSICGKIERSNGSGVFVFTWRETDGPTVTAPSRKGFGSVILEEAARQFANDVAIRFTDKGLVYELSIALDTIYERAVGISPRGSPEAVVVQG
jgi:PAS domain S-box-containing protein